MITKADQIKIKTLVENYWQKEVRSSEFIGIAKGKEVGHKIGDMVDEKTTDILKACGEFTIKHQIDSEGNANTRSMGDLWLQSNGVYNPINIKAGEHGKAGQPNLVSLKRVITRLLNHQIDSYYLLIMKIENKGGAFVPHVYLVDMLDYLDFVTFNSGPGQMMLKEAQFYPQADKDLKDGCFQPQCSLPVGDKVQRLYDMLEMADKLLIVHRDIKRKQIEKQLARYMKLNGHSIDAQKQEEELQLG